MLDGAKHQRGKLLRKINQSMILTSKTLKIDYSYVRMYIGRKRLHVSLMNHWLSSKLSKSSHTFALYCSLLHYNKFNCHSLW